MDAVDITHVLRSGRVMSIDFEGRPRPSWRYRFETPTMAVVISFRSEDCLIIHTVIRKGDS